MIDQVSATWSTPRLVGRSVELSALAGAWARATDGEAGVVLLGGDAGVGKSRLIRELGTTVTAEGGIFVVGATPSRGSVAQAFAPLTVALRNLFRMLDAPDRELAIGPARPDLARLLPELGEAGAVPAAFDQLSSEPGRLFEVVLALLDRLSARRPVTLVFEDIHWADPSSLDLIDFLARNLEGLRVLVLLSYRTDELHRTHPLRPALAELRRVPLVHHITLDPLDRDEVAILAADLAGGEL